MKIYQILLLLTLIFGVTYFILDRQLFYYGKNDFNFYNLLPLNIIPEDRQDHENGFALKDEHGFTIAAKGNTYKFNGKDILINEVLSYCFDANKVIAQIVDVNNEEYHIEFSSNKVKRTNQDIIVNVWDNNKIINSDEFKCMSIKGTEKKIKRIAFPRNYIMFIVIFLFIISIYKAIKNFKTLH